MEGLQPRWYSSAWILACCLYTNTSIGCLGSEALAENGSTYLQMVRCLMSAFLTLSSPHHLCPLQRVSAPGHVCHQPVGVLLAVQEANTLI